MRSRLSTVVVCAALAAACASKSDLNVLYSRGVKAAKKDEWDAAMSNLAQFTGAACPWTKPDRRCREAYLTLGRGHERRGAPEHAWASFDRALALPPHGKDAAVQADVDRVRQELADKQQQADGRGPILVRFRDEAPDEYSLRSVTVAIDFQPVVTRDKNAVELHGPDFLPLHAGSLPAGGHVLEVETVHDCKAGMDRPCTRQRTRRSWAFDTTTHEPMTLELRGYADAAEGGQPAQPQIELTKR
jgi:hypothetical protein